MLAAFAIQGSATVTVLADAEFSLNINEQMNNAGGMAMMFNLTNVTLDLNGKNVTVKTNMNVMYGDTLTITGNGTMTFVDNGNITVMYADAYKTNKSGLVVESGTFVNQTGTRAIIISTGATAIINGGTFKGTHMIASSYSDSVITITGGDFTDATLEIKNNPTVIKPAELTIAAPEGYAWENDTTLVIAPAIIYVAEVNGVQYETLQAAIDAANAGDTVTLLSDVTVSETVVIDKAVTLDLDGKTISTAEGVYLRYLLNVSGDATIKNGTVSTHAEKETTGANLSPAAILITGDVALDTVTVNGYQCVEVGAYDTWESPVADGASLTLTNSTITTGNRGLITNTTGTVTIEDSTLTGLEPVYMNHGNVVMNSGKIEATQSSVSTNNESSFTLNGGEISGILAIYEGTFTMEGGSIVCNDRYPVVTVNPYGYGKGGAVYIKAGNVSNTGEGGIIGGNCDGYIIQVSGGIFNTEILAEYCAEGYICVPYGDSLYTVVPVSYAASVTMLRVM